MLLYSIYSTYFAQIKLTILARLAGEPDGAETLSIGALPVPVAVRHLALVMLQLTLQALPAGVTPTLPILVVAIARAQDGTNTWREKEEKQMSLKQNIRTENVCKDK